ncbi:heme-binding domain-containing protein [Hydrotalea sp.]|uniref:heme-binding domain-containing protein n=1 Tax=Hydrotalea sp. TaxID=2881279 RepID=UPI00261109A9|nr:heme-binding domain-containing protein [Hydrotalea sp.]
MSRIKKIILALLILFAGIQFIHPAHNKSGQVLPTDFLKIYVVPNNVQTILQNACYDCHSNNTHYPWYSNIQPVAWMMASHVIKGKEELNFSDFGSYSSRRQISKLKGIANQINDDEMPISSYKMMHKNARLSKEQKDLVMDWMQKTADSLSANN